MWLKKFMCSLLSFIVLISSVCVNAGAIEKRGLNEASPRLIVSRATGSFSVTVRPYEAVEADITFPLEAGESVRINASYSPDASLDFGLVDSDGIFHYVNVTDGNIDQTIQVDTSGNYTLGIQNNSAITVKVSGFVRY